MLRFNGEAFLTKVVVGVAVVVAVVVVAVVADVVSESAKREMVFVLLSATLESRPQSRKLRYPSTAGVVLKAGMVTNSNDWVPRLRRRVSGLALSACHHHCYPAIDQTANPVLKQKKKKKSKKPRQRHTGVTWRRSSQ